MTKAMPFLQKAILLSYDPRPFRGGIFVCCFYMISCSNESNRGVEKNSPNVMSIPSHSFLMVMMDTSRRRLSRRLYTVEGVTPDRLASSLGLILFSRQRERNLSATASFTVILSPQKDCKKNYANAYTHLRNLKISCIIVLQLAAKICRTFLRAEKNLLMNRSEN